MEEVVPVDLTYVDICTLLESGTVHQSSALYVKLRAARGAFERSLKVYGGDGIKFREIAGE